MDNNAEFRLPVLLVDDEPKLLTSVRILLRSSGIESVDTLEDSRGVLPWLKKNPMVY
jgi:DNA-binding response OmpR family regulator